MRAGGEEGVYPNPGSTKGWTDGQGRTWTPRGDGLDGKRARVLLRRPGVLLATWQAGRMAWHSTPEDKDAAASALLAKATHPDDVLASEWGSQDGTVLLLLEHAC